MKLNGKTVLLRRVMILIMPEIEHEVEHNPAVDYQFSLSPLSFIPGNVRKSMHISFCLNVLN